MKERLEKYIKKTADKHDFNNAVMIEDFVKSALLAYNYYIHKGMNENKAYKLAIMGLGNLEEFFILSNTKKLVQGDNKNWVAHVGCISSTIVALIITFVFSNRLATLLLLPLFLLTLCLVTRMIRIKKRGYGQYQIGFELSKMFFCYLLNVALVILALLVSTLQHFYQGLGIILFCSNVLYAILISKEGLKYLLVSVPGLVISVGLFFDSFNYLIVLETILFIFLSFIIFIVFDTKFKEKYDFLVLAISPILIVLFYFIPLSFAWIMGIYCLGAVAVLAYDYAFLKLRGEPLAHKTLLNAHVLLYIAIFYKLSYIAYLYFKQHFGVQQISLSSLSIKNIYLVLMLIGIILCFKYLLMLISQYRTIKVNYTNFNKINGD